jgi:hypothetical protein
MQINFKNIFYYYNNNNNKNNNNNNNNKELSQELILEFPQWVSTPVYSLSFYFIFYCSVGFFPFTLAHNLELS